MGNIYSMTGYARASGRVSETSVTVEAKSVNHRYLDLKIHLPRELLMFENKVSELARSFFHRGRIELWVNSEPGERPVKVSWNRPLARGIMAAIQEMKWAFNLTSDAELALLASQKDVIIIADSGAFGDEAWSGLAAVVGECFQALQEMRAREGAALSEDIIKRLEAIEKNLDALSGEAGATIASYREKLEKRIVELMGDRGGIDPARLAQEVVIMADRADITEELVRARSHIGQFRAVLGDDGPKGRKLDFLTQELFREINTSSNKAAGVKVSGLAVDMKTELEKIREQVQNLE